MAEERVVLMTCGHNCGGRCVMQAHVKDGRLVKITPDAGGEGRETLKGCMRGLMYLDRLYHPDRLKQPLKRIGKRGEGKFTPISWPEAIAEIAAQLKRITERYGPEARYINYATGIAGSLSEREFFRRLLSIYGGGYLDFYNSYSTACTMTATPYTYGTADTGSSRDNWLHAKLILLWGHNPLETVFGTNTFQYLKAAKERGARIVVIDPRYSDTAAALADEWIALRPTTDNAVMAAMMQVMISEDLYDRAFVERFCLGFDETQMPPGIAPEQSLRGYLFGAADGIVKTPEWAAAISGVSAETIRRLAREYATRKPAALLQGWGPQRHANGEQAVRGATVLAALTGNVGILGGWASGYGGYSLLKLAGIPYENPVKTSISVYTWPQAIEDGDRMTAADGVKGAERLKVGIKFLASLAGNCLINQHSDITATSRLLADETKCEFILVSEEFMTSSAKFADIVLPSTNFLERLDLFQPWGYAEYAIFQNKVVEAEFERRTGYDWMVELAATLGVEAAFSQGRSYEEWARYIVEETRKRENDFPSYESFAEQGLYCKPREAPYIAFQKQIEAPQEYPFPTPSGKIEIFSPRLYALGRPEDIPAVPKYVASWEGPDDPLTREYPLQLIGWHAKGRTHSIFGNSARLEKLQPHCLWMHPEDAKRRKLKDGERVRVFNQRGTLEIALTITERIMQGVVAMPQGAWHRPDAKGVDQGACINTLTKYQPTPLAKGNPQHTNLVQVCRIQEEA
ncbi:DMSO/selenate family reductase complex A subunit [Azotosporobacter soli]|uniref:DMSO/selenate family reductase complex A subunit n=1 Tax=Azotosporobacter soli TaxID=3055040 RepID=UPI0031FF45D1